MVPKKNAGNLSKSYEGKNFDHQAELKANSQGWQAQTLGRTDLLRSPASASPPIWAINHEVIGRSLQSACRAIPSATSCEGSSSKYTGQHSLPLPLFTCGARHVAYFPQIVRPRGSNSLSMERCQNWHAAIAQHMQEQLLSHNAWRSASMSADVALV
jgi:hypothetical protein